MKAVKKRGIQKNASNKNYSECIQPKSECTFSFQWIINFKLDITTPRGDRHVQPLSFLWKIELSTTFTCSIFLFNQYFLQRSVLKWIYFPNQYTIILQTWQCLEPLAPLLGRWTYAPTEFLVANLILNNFYLKHFLIQSVFFGVFSSKENLLSCFSKVKYCAVLAYCDVTLTAL